MGQAMGREFVRLAKSIRLRHLRLRSRGISRIRMPLKFPDKVPKVCGMCDYRKVVAQGCNVARTRIR